MNLSMKQKQTHRPREQTWGCPGGEGRGRKQTGVWGQQMQTIMHKMDKQQGSAVQCRKLCSVSWDKAYGKEQEKERIYTYV